MVRLPEPQAALRQRDVCFFQNTTNVLMAPPFAPVRFQADPTARHAAVNCLQLLHSTPALAYVYWSMKRSAMLPTSVLWATGLGLSAAANAQQRAIDVEKSVMTVVVSKAGVLSAFGHNHDIAAPISRGVVDLTNSRVELYANAGALQVRDPEASDKDRGQIQTTMLGPEVLDAANHPEIAFRSTSAQPDGPDSWRLYGDLTLHGQTHAVAVEVKRAGEHYVGTSHFKQTDFGITPVKVAGGTIRVKDEVRIDFDIQLTH